MAKYEIHISDIRSFKQCRRKWDWSSSLRRNLERKSAYAPFFTGKAFHYGLQMYYEKGEVPAKAALRHINAEVEQMKTLGALWDMEEEMIQEQTALVMGILDHYYHWTRAEKGPLSDKNLRFMALETEFKVPFMTDTGRKSSRVYLGGRFDGVVQRIDDGSYWIWECKTTRSIKELEDSLANDEQASAYIIAAQKLLGVPISGVLYNIARKKVPTEPAILKDGNLSRRADLDSTADAYFSYAVDYYFNVWNGEVPVEQVRQFVHEQYDEYLKILLEKGNQFFKRVAVYRTPNEMVTAERDLRTVALEMVRPTTAIYPSPSWINCRFCHFRAACLAYNNGSDIEGLFAAEFQQRQNWDALNEQEKDGD